MSEFTPTQQEIQNVIDPQDNTFVIQDATNNTFKASVDASGALKVTGGGGGEQHLSGDSITGAKGTAAMGSDGTLFKFLSVDTTGQLNILTSQLPTALVGGRLDVNVGASALPTGAATSGNQTTEITSLQLIDDLPQLDSATITGTKGVGVLGSDGALLRWLKVDPSGSLQIAIQPSPNTFFSFGDVATSALTQVAIRRTAYTEQTTNAQRSIASNNAADTGVGTGAQQVKITYYDQTGAGPFTETVILSGVAFVNTTNSNICFIEELKVVSVGSGGTNVGIITLRAATAGGGAIIGTIGATDLKTFWAHHYVATGKTMKLTGISVSHNGTVVGSGAVFILKAKMLAVATAPEHQISDFVRLYGQSSTFSRAYNSPIAVAGPARVTVFVTPESTSNLVYRAAIDFNEA